MVYVILWLIIRHIYFVFVPVLGTELLKTFKFLKWEDSKDVFCCIDITWKSPKDGGWFPGEPTWRLVGWNFQPTLLTSRKQRRDESITHGQWFNQLYLYDETSIKTQKGESSEFLDWWTSIFPCAALSVPNFSETEASLFMYLVIWLLIYIL